MNVNANITGCCEMLAAPGRVSEWISLLLGSNAAAVIVSVLLCVSGLLLLLTAPDREMNFMKTKVVPSQIRINGKQQQRQPASHWVPTGLSQITAAAVEFQ